MITLFICLRHQADTIATFSSTRSYSDWQSDQVITTLKTTAKPVTDLSFPTVTVCAAGLHMENVKTVLERNFNDWRFENRKSWDAEDIEILMAEFMRETFQIKDKSLSILDLLNTMISPKVESSLVSNGVRENVAACFKKGRSRRKRELTGERGMVGENCRAMKGKEKVKFKGNCGRNFGAKIRM